MAKQHFMISCSNSKSKQEGFFMIKYSRKNFAQKQLKLSHFKLLKLMKLAVM